MLPMLRHNISKILHICTGTAQELLSRQKRKVSYFSDFFPHLFVFQWDHLFGVT